MAVGRYGRLAGMIRGFRRRAGFTQRETAELAGLSVGALRDIEQGRVSRPRASTLRRLGNVLELSRVERADLMREAEDEPDVADGLRVEVLGPLRVWIHGETVELGSETQRLLLGMLALSPNVPVMRDALVETLWGAQSGGGNVDSLQSRVSRLRRRLQPGGTDSESYGVLVSEGGGYQLTVADGQHDMLICRRLVTQARRAREAGELTEACRLFAGAVALWRGDPLAGLPALQSHPTVVALVRDYRTLVVEYAETACELGRYRDVLPLLQHAAEADPFHEAVHAKLMIALAGSGQQAAALSVFDSLRRRLVEEMGADPGAELTAAYQQVLRQEVSGPETAPVAAYRQLPPDIADFSGRDEQLREIGASLSVPAGGTAVTIVQIEGMGGVGKTRLAIHLAHRSLTTGRHGDVQLYVDLRGHADQPPADPSAVLASFLRLLGVPGDQIPPGIDERASLYRDRLYGTNALVLLDNAADENQVLPLLPAGPANLVLITSRRTLALDGARTFPLDVFTPAEAGELLARVVGAERVAAEPEAASRVVELCGRLPLAVALAARRLRSRSAWTIADFATRLEQADDRLNELAAGSRRLRAMFDQSYQALSGDEQRVFRLLGLHPGEDFARDSVAALAALPPSQAQHLLDRLVDENLAAVVARGRYRVHGLVREYARALAHEIDSEERRHEAHTRLLDFYLRETARAAHLLTVGEELMRIESSHLPNSSSRDETWRWLETECACLVGAAEFAARNGWRTHARRLIGFLRQCLSWTGCHPDPDWMRNQESALPAALAAGDSTGAALTHELAAAACLHRGRTEEARGHLLLALELHREAGFKSFEIGPLEGLIVTCSRLGEFAEALRHANRALTLCTEHAPQLEATVLGSVGHVLTLLGQFDDAMGVFRKALALSRQAGSADGEIRALAGIGDLHRRMGCHTEAIAELERALVLGHEAVPITEVARSRHVVGNVYRGLSRFDAALANFSAALRFVRVTDATDATVMESAVLVDMGATYREIGNLALASDLVDRGLRLAIARRERYQEARALHELAELHRCAARVELALDHWRQAQTLFEELGTPEADELRPLIDDSAWGIACVVGTEHSRLAG
ncbi:BTAD domain-containing putative transcriptional regulator [Amycolatopsis taiwanensis]|uniref:BTAD domain-containing putative transcriptional regulator n=1 Tax=Amycolatopsis taiwanensis TaxID=342230 RepID=UPI0004B7956F|nr:BTAD domain-containing putative transcriptional regulator [Amycolatopsis taiwanensis]